MTMTKTKAEFNALFKRAEESKSFTFSHDELRSQFARVLNAKSS